MKTSPKAILLVTSFAILASGIAYAESVNSKQGSQDISDRALNTNNSDLVFKKDLYFGLFNNQDVVKLQEFLVKEKYFQGPVTGNFLELTRDALKKFQGDLRIEPVLGYFGPKTMEIVNEIVKNKEYFQAGVSRGNGLVNPGSNPEPLLTGLSIASIPIGNVPEDSLALGVYGEDFIADSSVILVDGQQVETRYQASGHLQAIIPASLLTLGTHIISVFTSGPGGGQTKGLSLVVTENPVPAISSLSPPGMAATGDPNGPEEQVFVIGTGFVRSCTASSFELGIDLPIVFLNYNQLAVTIPGSAVAVEGTFTITIFCPLPGGGSTTVQFEVGAAGQLTINKTAVGGTATFPFSITGPQFGPLLTADIQGSGTVIIPMNYYGTYTVSEPISSSWVVTPTNPCVVTISSAGSATCNFTNTRNIARITLVKEIVGGGPARIKDWNLIAFPVDTSTFFSGTSGMSAWLNPGIYQLIEIPRRGAEFVTSAYTPGTWSCTGGMPVVGGTVRLNPLDDIVCTIQNSIVLPI